MIEPQIYHGRCWLVGNREAVCHCWIETMLDYDPGAPSTALVSLYPSLDVSPSIARHKDAWWHSAIQSLAQISWLGQCDFSCAQWPVDGLLTWWGGEPWQHMVDHHTWLCKLFHTTPHREFDPWKFELSWTRSLFDTIYMSSQPIINCLKRARRSGCGSTAC